MMNFTRSARIKRIIAGAAGITLVATLAACAPSGSTETADGGGTVRVGYFGSTADVILPQAAQTTQMDIARGRQVFEGLTAYAADGSVENVLAESLTPNEDLTVWTVKLGPDVKLHNGKTFAPADVIASIKNIQDPEVGSGGAGSVAFINTDTDIEVVDDTTLVFNLSVPYGDFARLWASDRMLMASWADGEPVGTGMFEVESFTPGQESTFSKFDDYWGVGPDFETLEIINFRDASAISNALRGGQIDIARSVSFTDIPTLEQSGIKILESKNSSQMPTIELRNDVAPFNDPKILEAMKLIVDREAVVQNVYGGYGSPANDMPTNLTTCEAPDLPQREQDIDRAKELLAEAGASDLSFDLTVSAATAPGVVELAQLYAQQAAEAGVTINVNQVDLATFFLDWKNWTAFVAFVDEEFTNTVAKEFITDTPANGINFSDAEFDTLAAQLKETPAGDEACAITGQLMEILHNKSGWIFPASVSSISAYSDKISGLKENIWGQGSVSFGGVSIAG